jgi:hypothetical protein
MLAGFTALRVRAPGPTPDLRAYHGLLVALPWFQLSAVSASWPSFWWQREVAECVVAGRGVIVAEFFDAGYSRRLPWTDRPEAAALLVALAAPDREFDAIVVGEYERAFFGDQLQQLLPLLDRHGVRLWLPRDGRPLDLTDPAHRALLLMLGAQSRREVLQARHRVLSAMRAQVLEQGRHLGGRPPTVTASWTPGRIPTGRTHCGVGGCTGWTWTR